MPITLQDLIDDPDWSSPHIEDELTHVQVWEFEGTYYLWDKINNELDELEHVGFKDFMDAAEAAEDDIIAEAPQAQRQALRQAVRQNSGHRGRKKTGRKKNVQATLPTRRGARGGRP